MSRKRMISPEFYTDEKILDLPIPARLLYIGMWNHANDEGIFKDSPKQLKVQVYPADEDITLPVIKSYIDKMITLKLLTKGTNIDGSSLLKVTKWEDWQKINRPTPSKYIFTPINEESVRTHGAISEDSVNGHVQLTEDSLPIEDKIIEVKLKEVKRKEKKIEVKEKSSKTKTEKIKEDFTFDSFYSLYPRKMRKDKALTAFNRIPLKNREDVLKGLAKWCEYWTVSATEVEFIPYPATWLNAKQYNDGIEVPEETVKFKDDLDKEQYLRSKNVANESKRLKRYMQEAGNKADDIPDLLGDYKKTKQAQPIGDIIGQVIPKIRPTTDTDGK